MIKTFTKIFFFSSMMLSASLSKAQTFNEGFEDIANLNGWELINMSNPLGSEPTWVQGYSPMANQTYYFTAYSGSDTSFICGSFNNTSGVGTISNWLISPVVSLVNGGNVSFWTRTTDLGGTVYPDRLQFYYSTDTTGNVGVDEFSTGGFTNLLTDINSAYTTTDYPLVWTQYSFPLTMPAPSPGRFAWRYFVEDAGPNGNNSFMVGIDEAVYTTVTSLTSVRPSVKVTTYPNPATELITFDFGAPLEANARITVSNKTGQAVMEGQINKGTKAQVVNVGKLSSGTYMIIITDEHGKTFRSHFAKN